MVAQLSTSEQLSQLGSTYARIFAVVMLFMLPFQTPALAQGSSWMRPTEVEQRVDPLSAIDLQFMASQRAEVEALANRLGRRLTNQAERDIDTLQVILDRGMIDRDDTQMLQAMGIVFGDLLADTLDMDWIVYRDRAGRSRALRYRDSKTYLFPVTMISRRYAAGNRRPLADIFDEVVAETRARLPGANWR